MGSRHTVLKRHSAFEDFNNFQNLDIETYDVENLYHEKGICQEIAKNEYFKNIVLGVIVANAVYLGIEVEHGNNVDMDRQWVYTFFDNTFCIFFMFELAVRFFAFVEKINACRDPRFKFDFFLVVLAVIDTWAMPLFASMFNFPIYCIPSEPLRLLRMARLSRLARIVHDISELWTLTRGLATASRAVASFVVMIIAMLYVFSLFVLQLLKDEPLVGENFSTLLSCMWTLFLDGTIMDNTGDALNSMLQLGTVRAYLAVIVFMGFFLLSALTLMNMLIGVLCEVVSTVLNEERNERDILDLKATVLVELKKFDINGDGVISKDEVRMALVGMTDVLDDLQIDHDYISAMVQLLYTDPKQEVQIKEIMNLILSSRGDRPVIFQHIVDQMKLTHWFMRSEIQETQAIQRRMFISITQGLGEHLVHV